MNSLWVKLFLVEYVLSGRSNKHSIVNDGGLALNYYRKQIIPSFYIKPYPKGVYKNKFIYISRTKTIPCFYREVNGVQYLIAVKNEAIVDKLWSVIEPVAEKISDAYVGVNDVYEFVIESKSNKEIEFRIPYKNLNFINKLSFMDMYTLYGAKTILNQFNLFKKLAVRFENQANELYQAFEK